MPISQDRLWRAVSLARQYRNLADSILREQSRDIADLQTEKISFREFLLNGVERSRSGHEAIAAREAALVSEEIQFQATANKNRAEKERRERLRRAEGRPIRKQAPEMSWATTNHQYATPQTFENMAQRNEGRSPDNGPNETQSARNSMPRAPTKQDFDFSGHDQSNLDPMALAAQLPTGGGEAPDVREAAPPPPIHSDLSQEEKDAYFKKWEEENNPSLKVVRKLNEMHSGANALKEQNEKDRARLKELGEEI